MEAAGLALGCLSLVCSVFSTAYDIEIFGRDAREIRTVLERLRNGAENVKFESSRREKITYHYEMMRQACDKISSAPTPYDREQGTTGLRRRLGRMLRDRESGWPDTGPLGEDCGKWLHICQRRATSAQPMLWKLEDWILRQTEDILRIVRSRAPEMLKAPSPQALLISWVVLALVLTYHHGRDSGHGHTTLILLCSVGAAVGLGFIEGSGSTSIVLTNIPWCLTFGVLFDSVLSTASSSLSRRTVWVEQSMGELDDQKQKRGTF